MINADHLCDVVRYVLGFKSNNNNDDAGHGASLSFIGNKKEKERRSGGSNRWRLLGWLAVVAKQGNLSHVELGNFYFSLLLDLIAFDIIPSQPSAPTPSSAQIGVDADYLLGLKEMTADEYFKQAAATTGEGGNSASAEVLTLLEKVSAAINRFKF